MICATCGAEPAAPDHSAGAHSEFSERLARESLESIADREEGRQLRA